MTVAAILARLDDPKWSTARGGWIATCLACGDGARTLTVTLSNGVGVAGCLNGCTFAAIQAAFDARLAGACFPGRARMTSLSEPFRGTLEPVRNGALLEPATAVGERSGSVEHPAEFADGLG